MSDFNPFEKEIKKTVLNHLLYKGKIKNDTIVINELTIDSFARRVDLAMLVDGKIIAYEIKVMQIASTGYLGNLKSISNTSTKSLWLQLLNILEIF